MPRASTSHRRSFAFVLLLFALPLLITCGKKTSLPTTTEQVKQAAPTAPPYSPDEPPAPSNGLVLPTSFDRDTRDLDAMAQRRNIRALVILNPISFFPVSGMRTTSCAVQGEGAQL